jgi:hypothetical protein
MSSLFRYAGGIIAKFTAAAMKWLGGGKAESIRLLPRAHCGSNHIRSRKS